VGLLDRYLAREILLPFAAGLLFLTQILLATSILSQTEVLLGSGVSARDLAWIIALLVPQFVSYVLPVAFMLGCVLGVGRLAEDREVIALGAAGLSPVRLVRVPLLLGVATAALGLCLSLVVEPASLRQARILLNDVVKRNVTNDVRPGTFYEHIPGLTLYAEQVQRGAWKNVLIHDRTNPDAPVLALAREGRLEPVGTGQEMELALQTGEIHREEADSDDYFTAQFRRAELVVGLGTTLSDRNALARSSKELTVAELLERGTPGPNQSPQDALRYQGYLQRRIAAPLAVLAFALLSVPIAAARRSARAFGVTATFLVVVAQYLLMRGGEILAQRGALPPVLALQIPLVVLGGAGIALLALLGRRGPGAVR
jgi:lipopolysaccharide export system permease protein